MVDFLGFFTFVLYSFLNSDLYYAVLSLLVLVMIISLWKIGGRYLGF